MVHWTLDATSSASAAPSLNINNYPHPQRSDANLQALRVGSQGSSALAPLVQPIPACHIQRKKSSLKGPDFKEKQPTQH